MGVWWAWCGLVLLGVAGCGGPDRFGARGRDGGGPGATPTADPEPPDRPGVGVRPGDDGDDDPVGTTPTEWTTPPTETVDGVPVPPELPQAALTAIRNQLDGLLAGTRATHGVYVVDLENGQAVYASHEDVPYKPASNTKLFTTAVALDTFGADHRFEVAAWSDSVPDAEGEVGSLDVVGGHDFTWSSDFHADEFFAAERLAATLWDAGLRRIRGALTVRGELAVEAYHYGTYDAEDHREVALGVLLVALEDRGIAVDGPLRTADGFAEGPVLLGRRRSVGLATACHPLNVHSNNEMADLLARHNGWELWGDVGYAGGEAAALDWLAGKGIDTTDLNLDDGSGLSHDNRVTARAVVGLLAALADAPVGEDFRRTLSVGGVIGTLAGRLGGDDTWGRVHAKTGTLTGVSAVSGTLFNRYDGHRYLFSILMNETESADAARALQDEMLEVLAADLRHQVARPSQPVLAAVRSRGDGTLEARWGPVAGATEYTVWVSLDGAWRRTGARATSDTSLVIAGLPPDRTVRIRVDALGPGGVSDPSDVYAARTGASRSRVLVVDGNDRYQWQFENPLGIGHELAAHLGLALGDLPFDTAANEQVIAGAVALGDYEAVAWVLGEESEDDATFDPAERVLVADFLGAGGAMFVSGAEIGWDLDATGTDDSRAFYADQLHAELADDDAGTTTAEPVSGGLFEGLGDLGFYAPGLIDVRYPDVLEPVGWATAELRYVGGRGGTAAVSYRGGFRLVHLGFPLEAIDDAWHREQVVGRSFAFLLGG